MMHEFVTYADGTLVFSSDIRKKENGEEYIIVCFERPMEYGFDTVISELPSYDIIKNDEHYTEDEIAIFKTVVERGTAYFFEYELLDLNEIICSYEVGENVWSDQMYQLVLKEQERCVRLIGAEIK